MRAFFSSSSRRAFCSLATSMSALCLVEDPVVAAAMAAIPGEAASGGALDVEDPDVAAAAAATPGEAAAVAPGEAAAVVPDEAAAVVPGAAAAEVPDVAAGTRSNFIKTASFRR